MMNVKRSAGGITFAILGTALAAATACSDDDTSAAPGGPVADAAVTGDGAKTDDTSNGDGGKGDGGKKDDPKNGGKALRIHFVHGSSDLGPIRLCVWNSATKFASLDTPLPDVASSPAGIRFGDGGPLSVPAATLASFPSLSLAIYTVPASASPTTTCSTLIPGTGTDPPPEPATGDVHYLGTLSGPPTPAFNAGKSHLLVIVGCKAGVGADDAARRRCGAAYDNTPNLRTRVLELEEPPVTTEIGAQFVQLSPELQSTATSGVFAAFTVPGALDIGGPASFPVTNTAPIPIVPDRPARLTGVFATPAATRFQLYVNSGGAKEGALLGDGVTLSSIEQASNAAAGFLTNGKTFTFIALGDPALAAGDALGFRILAINND